MMKEATAFTADALRRAAVIQLVIFDIDGVLTDGRLYYSDAGEEMKAFQVQDGYAIKLLREHGVEVAIITGRTSTIVARRAAELGIVHLYQGAEDKTVALNDLMKATRIQTDEIAHVGDDLPDLTLFDRVGFAISVPNGHPTVIKAANHVTAVAGGEGVAREVCQLILTAKDLWPYR
ncbi:MAG: HAD-IIIA family hydrolase [Gammaproteobacteria bacterium]|nr:HAD-IIIA family hydrolase [Gammaproteobacteria bacterium]